MQQIETLYGHPSVLLDKDISRPEGGGEMKTNQLLLTVLTPLLSAKPWRYVVHRVQYSASANGYGHPDVIAGVKVYDGKDWLGSIVVTTKRKRGSWAHTDALCISNERIGAKRIRGSSYTTDSVEKATVAIRKYFYGRTTDERVDKALSDAYRIVTDEVVDKRGTAQDRKRKLLSSSERFVMPRLQEYVDAFGLHEALETFRSADAQYQTVDSVKNALDNGSAVVVVLHSSEYLVCRKLRDGETSTNIYTHDTLPYELREKVGMLKLVEDKQMISDIGCRVSSEAFVVIHPQ